MLYLLLGQKQASGGCVQGASRPAHTPQSLYMVAKQSVSELLSEAQGMGNGQAV